MVTGSIIIFIVYHNMVIDASLSIKLMVVMNARMQSPEMMELLALRKWQRAAMILIGRGVNGCITIKRINIPIYKYDNSVE